MRKFVNRLLAGADALIILCGVAAMVLFFVAPQYESRLVIGIIGAVGILYLMYAGFLWFCNRVMFDWHMINGHFLRKVVCLVLLLPFVATSVVQWSGVADKMTSEIVYDESLYGGESAGADESVAVAKPVAEKPSLLWTIYYHYMDPGNQDMALTPTARVLVALIAILGIFLLNGLLVSSIIGWIDRRKERWLRGEIDYVSFLRRKRHYVVIGGCDLVAGVVRQIFEREAKGEIPYVVIQTSGDVDALRRELCSTFSVEAQKHLIFRYGDRTSLQDVRELAFESVPEVFILGEPSRADDVESNHDTLNMECLKHIVAICNPGTFKRKASVSGKLKCHILFEYQTAYAALKIADVYADTIKFYPFNFYELWAQRVLVGREECVDSVNAGKDYAENSAMSNVELPEKSSCRYEPLDGFDGIGENSEKVAHLIIVGMSRMGVALGIEAAHLSHYPNFVTKGIRTRVTFIDANAEQEMAFFKGRFKWMFELSHWRYTKSHEKSSLHPCTPTSEPAPLYVSSSDTSWHTPDIEKYGYLGGDFLDVEWEFIDGTIESASVRDYLVKAVEADHGQTTIAVCLPEPNRAVAASLYLPSEVFDKARQVLVYQRHNDSMVREISRNNPLYKRLKPFGLAQDAYDYELIADGDKIGAMVGAEYGSYEDKFKRLLQSEGITQGEKEQAQNGKTKSAKLWSNRYSSYMMWSKFRSVGFNPKPETGKPAPRFTPEEVAILAKVEHNRWNMEQLLLGYRPLTPQEQAECKSCKTEDGYFPQNFYAQNEQKELLKGRLAHLDICSVEVLNAVELFSNSELDEALVAVLPAAYRICNGMALPEEK